MKRILTLLHCILILGCVTFLGCVIFFQGCQKGNKTSLRQYTVVVEAGPKGSVYMNGRHFLFLGKTKTVKVNEGVSLYFEFVPNWGCDVDSLWVDGRLEFVSPNQPYYPLPKISADHTLKVTFRENVYGLLTSQKPWVRDSVYIKDSNGKWVYQATDHSESFKFSRPGKRYQVTTALGIVSEGFWSMNGNDVSGKIGIISDENPAVITLEGPISYIIGTSWKVLEITDNKMKVILTSHDAPGNADTPVNAWNYQFVFSHP